MRFYKRSFVLLAVLALIFCLSACTESADRAEDTQLSLVGPSGNVSETSGKVTYTVKVVNEAGKPVANCAVQLCLDVCILGFSNEDGTAVISAPEADYKVSVTVAPEGYSFDPEEEFSFEEGSYEMTITLKAA